jgi:diphthine synthase
MFYLIGLGINKNNLTNYIIEKIKSCDLVIIEKYTSFFEDYNWLINFLKENKINFIEAKRDIVEEELLKIIKDNGEKKERNTALLVFGDVMIATTHSSLLVELKKEKIPFEIIHNVSILNLITRTGLSIYKFGKIISIPFLIRDKRIKIETPIKVIKENESINAHTLLLLDLDPVNNDYLKAEEALEYLLNNGINNNLVVCSRLGWKDEKIIYIKELSNEKIEEIKKLKLKVPICIVKHSNLNIGEEEYIKNFLL